MAAKERRGIADRKDKNEGSCLKILGRDHFRYFRISEKVGRNGIQSTGRN